MECASGKMKVGTHKWVSAFFVAAEAKVGEGSARPRMNNLL